MFSPGLERGIKKNNFVLFLVLLLRLEVPTINIYQAKFSNTMQ